MKIALVGTCDISAAQLGTSAAARATERFLLVALRGRIRKTLPARVGPEKRG